MRMVRLGKLRSHCFANPDESYFGFSVEGGNKREWMCEYVDPITGEVEEYTMTVVSIDMFDSANRGSRVRYREKRSGGQEEYFDKEEIKLHFRKRHPRGNVRRIPHFSLTSL
jgi:hypothetical protein